MVSLTAAEGHKIYEMGKDPYGAVGQTTVKPEVADRYVEIPVGQILPYSEEQYKAKVDELVKQRYPQREENALQRKMINALLSPAPMLLSDPDPSEATDPAEDNPDMTADPAEDPPYDPAAVEDPALAEYLEYNAYVENCKAEAKRLLSS